MAQREILYGHEDGIGGKIIQSGWWYKRDGGMIRNSVKASVQSAKRCRQECDFVGKSVWSRSRYRRGGKSVQSESS